MPNDERGEGNPARSLDEGGLESTVLMGSDEVGGSVIGRYRLVQKIGEGGMGEVWLAEQKEPVRRRVALKLVKAGMNSREVIARFESERQALALMNHPAIAKVLDAGSTPQAVPYFVMEYVAGSPITTYCDEHKLNTRERLELFIQVCEGVQHAHHKSIVHRDLKPSNILVTEVGGKPAPKIIDFGVAKALTEPLTTDGMLTRVGTLIGTPEYMSPEQASSSGADIDTRTDVYSLGVVFYEFVTGAPPLDFKNVTLQEFLIKLREQEPSKPSTSIRTRDNSAKSDLSAKRRTPRPMLEREIRGDLDAIALKALEKDRSRRYSTPSDFAADIRRYLNHEPVLAVRPSVAYRARKFARRYRIAIATAMAFFIVLVAATAISIRQSVRANREAATARAISDFLQNDLIVQANPFRQGGQQSVPDLKVRTLLDRASARVSNKFKNQPELEAAIRRTIARGYRGLGDYASARSNLERAAELFRKALGPDNRETLYTETLLGFTLLDHGDYGKAEALLSGALERERRIFGRGDPGTLETMNYLATLKDTIGKLDEAVAIEKEVIEGHKRLYGPEHFNTLLATHMLGRTLINQNKYAEAEALMRQLIDTERRTSGVNSPMALRDMSLLGQAYTQEGKFKEAEDILNEVVEGQTRTAGPENPSTLASLTGLANLYTDEKRYPEAEALHLRVLDIKRRTIGPRGRQTLNSLSYLLTLYLRQEKYSQAEPYAAEALAARRQTLGSDNPLTIDSAANLAEVFIEERKFGAAEPLAREANQWDEKHRAGSWARFRSKALLGASLAGQKKFADAEPRLLEGYQGMIARKQEMDSDDLAGIDRVARWIAAQYDDWGKPDQAAKWRQQPPVAK